MTQGLGRHRSACHLHDVEHLARLAEDEAAVGARAPHLQHLSDDVQLAARLPRAVPLAPAVVGVPRVEVRVVTDLLQRGERDERVALAREHAEHKVGADEAFVRVALLLR